MTVRPPNARALEAEGHDLIARGHAKLAEAARVETIEHAPRTSALYTLNDLPAGHNRRYFARRCKDGKVEGARLEGRVWLCSRTAWHASFGAREVEPTNEGAQVYDLDASIARAGIRGTRRGAR